MVIFQIIVFVFLVIIHEVSHGLMAKELGDDTAEKMGRLTLNPLAHLDPFGSVLLPLMMYLFTEGKLIFGWAKPVPYNPLNLKHPLKDQCLIALAGPLANLVLALLFGLVIRFVPFLPSFMIPYLALVAYISIMFAIFNLIPLPPLDGSKVLFYLFPSWKLEAFLNRYGPILLLVVIFFGWNFIQPVIDELFTLMTGLAA